MNTNAFSVEVGFRSVYLGILLVIVVIYLISRLLDKPKTIKSTFYFSLISLLVLSLDLACFFASFWHNDGRLAAYFNLAYEMALFLYIPVLLNYVGEFLDDTSPARRLLRNATLGALVVVLLAITAGLIHPPLIVQLEPPWLKSRLWNIGRGLYGPLTRIRDIVAFVSMVSLAVVALVQSRRAKDKRYHAILVGGILVNFVFVFDSIYANSSLSYFFFPSIPYPRFLSGMMIFLLVNVTLDLIRFIEKSIAMDHTLEQLKASQEKLVVLAYYDSLTGLPNRKSFFEKIEMLCLENLREPRVMALMFLDFDLFRIANETLGHAGGDGLIKEAVLRIRQSLRSSDLLFRLGGDEFMLILTGLNSATDAGLVAQKLIGLMEDPFEVEATTIHLSLSIGISVMPRDGKTANELYRKADEALTDAKRDRNTFRFYTSALNAEAVKKISIINTLRHAISNDHFELYYQPLVDAQGRAPSAEALIRLKNGASTIGPSVFIPVAEQSGLMQPIGNWVLRRVAQDYVELIQDGFAPKISVNLSPRQLREGNFLAYLDSLANEYRLGFDPFYLEITETVLLEKDNLINTTLKGLFDRGVALVIDDFGIGFSNLSYIRDLPLRAIKIDRSFIQPLNESQRTAQMVASIIHLAKALDMVVVAEGVEDEYQRDFVFANGADLCQGFYFSRPLPLNGLKTYLSRQKYQ